MPFGLGARTCIGKNVSLLEINKLVPVLVRDFDIDFVTKDGGPLKADILPGKNRWFVVIRAIKTTELVDNLEDMPSVFKFLQAVYVVSHMKSELILIL